MLKKTTVSAGLAAAASAGVLLLTGSPASAQAGPASAPTSTGHVQTTGTSADRHWNDHRNDFRGRWWGHAWGENWRHHPRHHVHNRGWKQAHRDATVVIKSSTTTTKVSVGG